MKYLVFSLLIFTSAISFSDSKDLDLDMVGAFAGSAKNEDGLLKEWIIARFPDGSYKILFDYDSSKTEFDYSHYQEGIWSTDSGNVSMAFGLDRPVVYSYGFVDDNCVVHYMVDSPDGDDQQIGYNFKECKIDIPLELFRDSI